MVKSVRQTAAKRIQALQYEIQANRRHLVECRKHANTSWVYQDELLNQSMSGARNPNSVPHPFSVDPVGLRPQHFGVRAKAATGNIPDGFGSYDEADGFCGGSFSPGEERRSSDQ